MPYVKLSDITLDEAVLQTMPIDVAPYEPILYSKIRRQGEDKLGKWFKCKGSINAEDFKEVLIYMATDTDNNYITSVTGTEISQAKGGSVYVGAPDPPFGTTTGMNLSSYLASKVSFYAKGLKDTLTNDIYEIVIGISYGLSKLYPACNYMNSFKEIFRVINQLENDEIVNLESEYITTLCKFLKSFTKQIESGFTADFEADRDDYDAFKIGYVYDIIVNIHSAPRICKESKILIILSIDSQDISMNKFKLDLFKTINYLDAKFEDDDDFFNGIEIVSSQDLNISKLNKVGEFKSVYFIGHSVEKRKQFVYYNGYAQNQYFLLDEDDIQTAFDESTSIFLFSCFVNSYKNLKFENVVLAKEDRTKIDVYDRFIYGFIACLRLTRDVELSIRAGQITSLLENNFKDGFIVC